LAKLFIVAKSIIPFAVRSAEYLKNPQNVIIIGS
jgi:hypothetical protein